MIPGTLPAVERLYNGSAILAPLAAHPWENAVTFNPACVLVDDRAELDRIIPGLPFPPEVVRRLAAAPALCFLLYRAQGKKTESYDHTRSTMGLAVLSPDLRLLARHDAPVLRPEYGYENLGVEDGRLSKVGDRYVLFYTAYASASPENLIRIALASTTDFIHWEKHGLLKGDPNTVDNKNAMLFQGRRSGKFVMLHRPMKGTDAMAIHWAESEDLFGSWKTLGPLMKPVRGEGFVDTWIGGGAPPIRLTDGRHLMLYHSGNRNPDGTREYDLGIAILDWSRPAPVIRRDEPLLRPSTQQETSGDRELGVNNVVFICGAYFWNGSLWFPYAGADSVVLGARIAPDALAPYLE
jgi:predicted GH43/DUF377 family glycosyl hydrolase